MDDDLLEGAPLQAYLEIAERYYHEDRLDAAMKVVEDAFEHAGWPAGSWTAFYNALVCEKDARDASDLRRIGENLSLELTRAAPLEMVEIVRDAALKARGVVGDALGVQWRRPVIVTIFLPDAAVDFIVGSYGYCSHRTALDKVCLPYDTVETRREALDALTHELSHVATYELAGGEPPQWLDEGIATYLCRDLLDRQARFVISTAARSGRMLNLRRIEGVFNDAYHRKDDPERVHIAYTLAGSFVDYWVRTHGMDTVRRALVAISEGEDAEDAVHDATGVPLNRLEEGWRQELSPGR